MTTSLHSIDPYRPITTLTLETSSPIEQAWQFSVYTFDWRFSVRLQLRCHIIVGIPSEPIESINYTSTTTPEKRSLRFMLVQNSSLHKALFEYGIPGPIPLLTTPTSGNDNRTAEPWPSLPLIPRLTSSRIPNRFG